MRANAGTAPVTFAIPKRAGRIVLALVILIVVPAFLAAAEGLPAVQRGT